MVDFTLCSNKTCPMRSHCKRQTTKGNDHQSYSYFMPRENGECQFYLPVDKIQHINDSLWRQDEDDAE